MLILNKNRKGFTIAEVLAATAIVSVSLVILVQAISMVAYQDAVISRRMASMRAIAEDLNVWSRQDQGTGTNIQLPNTIPVVSRSATATTNAYGMTVYTVNYSYTNVDTPVTNSFIVYKR